MGANHGTIQHEILIVRIARQILKDSLLHASFGPAGETLVDGFVLTVPLWATQLAVVLHQHAAETLVTNAEEMLWPPALPRLQNP